MEIEEYSKIQKQENEKNTKLIEETKQIIQEKKDIMKEYDKKTEQYEIDKKKREVEKENNLKQLENIKEARSDCLTKTLELDKKLQVVVDKEKEINQSNLNAEKQKKLAEEKLQELESKKIQITKMVTDFQEEKYRFLVMMKSKDIKKNDLKTLEDNFNIDV